MNYQTRRALFSRIEEARNSKAILYVTGDRPGQETQIGSDVLDHLAQHLDKIGVVDRISFILYTRGGETLAAWSIVNLLRMFCDYLEVIVPSKCHSAGTLLCLGADNLVMTKQALLGPIDPTVFAPLGPRLPGNESEAPFDPVGVSVEDINAFMNQARESLPNQSVAAAFDRLADAVNPLVIGSAFRARGQIRMLGRRLLSNRISDEAKIDKVLDFLCSDSGSHDYTINRREAEHELGLPIERPSWDLYETIDRIHQSYVSEMNLRTHFIPREILGPRDRMLYPSYRALIESVELGSHRFVSKFQFEKTTAEIQHGLEAEFCRVDRQSDLWEMQHADD